MPNALASMVEASATGTDSTLLCAHDGGTQKTIFALEEGAVTFVRHVPSDAPGWSEFDLQNISMTLDYCFQALRIRPTITIALNASEPPSPMKKFEPPEEIQRQSDISFEYQHLLAALAYPLPKEQQLLPEEYTNELANQDILSWGIKIFSTAILITVFLAAYFLYSITSLKKDIALLRLKDLDLHPVLAAYNEAAQERGKIEPLLNAISAENAMPSVPALLKILPPPPPHPASVKFLTVKRDKDTITFQLSGAISSPNYAAAQDIFEQYALKIAAVPGVTVTTRKMESKEQTFTIEAGYKP